MKTLSLFKKKEAKYKPAKRPLKKVLKKYWLLYVMLIPCFLYIAFFEIYPLHGLLLAFKNYSFAKGIWGSDWVGLRYFKVFFNTYELPRMIKNTLVLGFMTKILERPWPIILALVLNEIRNMKFKKVAQTISYLPHFLSTVVLVSMVQKLLAPNTGMLNQIIMLFGGDGSTYFLNEKKYFYIILYLLDIWEGIGWSSIIYLSALSGVNPELYEAVEIDGGGRFAKMWHVSLPAIVPTIGLLFIMGIGSLFSSSGTLLWLLKTPGNLDLAETIDLYTLRVGLVGGQYGYGTAVGIVQAIVGFTLVTVANKVSKKFTDVAMW